MTTIIILSMALYLLIGWIVALHWVDLKISDLTTFDDWFLTGIVASFWVAFFIYQFVVGGLIQAFKKW